MSQSEQLTIDRGAPSVDQTGERDARRSLRGQVARLERECSEILAGSFPYISVSAVRGAGDPRDRRVPAVEASSGPRLLSLEQLELQRDRLVGRLGDLRLLANERAEHELRSHELLERMKLEPGRYKFARLPVRDLGQGGCGVWEVRPRLGLIGMLAGWWHVKLSSGCPLPRGSRSTRGPSQPS